MEGLSPPAVLLDAQCSDQIPLPTAPSCWLGFQSAFVFICPHVPCCWCRCQLRFLISITTSSLFPDSLSAEPTGCFDVLETKTMSHGRIQGKCFISRCLPKPHFRAWQPLQRHRSQGCDRPYFEPRGRQDVSKGQKVSHPKGMQGYSLLRQGLLRIYRVK